MNFSTIIRAKNVNWEYVANWFQQENYQVFPQAGGLRVILKGKLQRFYNMSFIIMFRKDGGWEEMFLLPREQGVLLRMRLSIRFGLLLSFGMIMAICLIVDFIAPLVFGHRLLDVSIFKKYDLLCSGILMIFFFYLLFAVFFWLFMRTKVSRILRQSSAVQG